MAFNRFIEALRETGRQDDVAFARRVKAYQKKRGGDIPVSSTERAGNIVHMSAKAKNALEKRYGKENVVYVELREETLAQLEKRTKVKSYPYGRNAEAAVNLSAMNAEVAVILPDPIPKKTYGEPFVDQKDILAKIKPINGLTFTYPQTPADAVSIGQGVFEQTEINILANYTRVGKDGSLIVGGLNPGGSVRVVDVFPSDGSDDRVGLLSLAVSTLAIGR